MITRCGDDCTHCPRFIPELEGRSAKLEEVRELWTRLGLKGADLPVERMGCRGCLPQNDCAYPELRACVTAKGYESCGPCTEYPCTRTMAMFSSTRDLEARAEKACTQEELKPLRKAFLSKKAHLDRIHRARFGAAPREEARSQHSHVRRATSPESVSG